MKSIVNRMVVVLMVGALTCVAAFAKVHRHTVTFDSDIKVNDTVVKKGTYQVKFDDGGAAEHIPHVGFARSHPAFDQLRGPDVVVVEAELARGCLRQERFQRSSARSQTHARACGSSPPARVAGRL